MTKTQYYKLCRILGKKPTNEELKEMGFSIVNGIFDDDLDADIDLYEFEKFKNVYRENKR